MGVIWSTIRNILFFFFGSWPTTRCSLDNEPGCFSRKTMDAFAQLHGVARYDEKQANRLHSCLQTYSQDGGGSLVNLQAAFDKSWEGFVALGIDETEEWGGDSGFIEFDPTPLPQIDGSIVGDISITEPCNAVSNFAYLRTMVEICDRGTISFAESPAERTRAFVVAFSTLGFGSTFFHSGLTFTGFLADNLPIDLIAFNIHQTTVSSFPFDPYLYDLSPSDRAETAIDATETLARIFLEVEPENWATEMGTQLDLPPYELTFSGFVAVLLSIIFDEATATSLADTFGSLLLSPENVGLVRNELLPVIRRNVETVDISLLARADLFLKLAGGALKMVSAFLWQETVLDLAFVDTIIGNPFANTLGKPLSLAINALANSLTRYKREPSIQLSHRIYPGEGRCRAQIPHSKWHEFSANALFDLLLLARDTDDVLRGRSALFSRLGGDSSLNRRGCQLASTGGDDQAMKNFADCIVTATPVFSCFRDCVEDSASFGSCLLRCLGDRVLKRQT